MTNDDLVKKLLEVLNEECSARLRGDYGSDIQNNSLNSWIAYARAFRNDKYLGIEGRNTKDGFPKIIDLFGWDGH